MSSFYHDPYINSSNMKNTQILILLMLLMRGLHAQNTSCDVDACNDKDHPCGPVFNQNNRTEINGETLKTTPYNAIIHQSIHRIGHSYASTSSFIAPNILITAAHNVQHYLNVKRNGFTFYNYGISEKGIDFKKNEVIVLKYRSHFHSDDDIAVIIFTDAKKIAPLYKGKFALATKADIKNPSAPVHLAGYPCDKDGKLMEKHITANQLHASSVSTNVIGYDMYTCIGDSGEPLWADLNGMPTIIGIHHGGRENYFDDAGCFNISAAITEDVLKWIGGLILAHPAK